MAAKFIGELTGVNTKTDKRGRTETVVTFKVDNNRYGKMPEALADFQGLPCVVNMEQNEDTEDDGEGNAS
jgi:hypothetical protein